MVTKARRTGDASRGPSGPVSPANNPMTREPSTLTASVPQGNVLCVASAIQVDIAYLKALPIAPPIMTAA